MPEPPMRLSFLSTIMKAWHRFWARWSQDTQERQLKGFKIMVQSLVWTSSFLLIENQKHPWARTTLLHLQWTRTISWRGLDWISHLMRWRYFIWTHPAKCKMTRTDFNWKRSDLCNITQTSNQFLLCFYHFWELGNLRLSKGFFIEKFSVSLLTLRTDLILWICREIWFTNSLP